MLAGCGEGGFAGSVRNSQPASLLHEAVQAGRFKEARRSIADGARLDAQDGDGFTCRISPLERGSDFAVSARLGAGVDDFGARQIGAEPRCIGARPAEASNLQSLR